MRLTVNFEALYFYTEQKWALEESLLVEGLIASFESMMVGMTKGSCI